MTAEEALRRDYRGTRLLLAEDDLINQEVALGLLRDTGFAVDLAVDGAQALALATSGNYALILMDMQMPDMDGVEATRRIRALPQGSSVPIIAMTANAFADDRERCFAAGMNDFIAKPIDPVIVFATLLKWLPVQHLTERSAVAVPAAVTTAPTLADADQLACLEHLPGFDVVRGLKAVHGNATRYLALLQLLIEAHASDMNQLRASTVAGDRDTALRLAHKLKGAAATLGADALAEVAKRIELHLRNVADIDAADKVLQTDITALEQVFMALAAVLPAPTSGCPDHAA
jgi:two-component system sensor histidine kinase/response regulator